MGYGDEIAISEVSEFLVVNSNFGDLVLVELNNANTQVVIANGGSRGDYVTPDYTNGTLR
jgi:hypothetical protein